MHWVLIVTMILSGHSTTFSSGVYDSLDACHVAGEDISQSIDKAIETSTTTYECLSGE